MRVHVFSNADAHLTVSFRERRLTLEDPKPQPGFQKAAIQIIGLGTSTFEDYSGGKIVSKRRLAFGVMFLSSGRKNSSAGAKRFAYPDLSQGSTTFKKAKREEKTADQGGLF